MQQGNCALHSAKEAAHTDSLLAEGLPLVGVSAEEGIEGDEELPGVFR